MKIIQIAGDSDGALYGLGDDRHTSRSGSRRDVGGQGMKTVTVQVELSDAHAMALAQFVKRVTWSDIRQCAVDDEEAYVMRDALDKAARALVDKGYAPR